MSSVGIVTGANRGIGLEIVKQLAATRSFAAIYLAARNPAAGEEAAAAVRRDVPDAGDCIRVMQLDITAPESVAQASALLAKSHASGIDVLINNAGVFPKHEGDGAQQRNAVEAMNVNFFASRAVTEAFAPVMKQGTGRIVNVASRLGALTAFSDVAAATLRAESLTMAQLEALVRQYTAEADPAKAMGWTAMTYHASKAAEIALTRIHARAYAHRGLAVNAVCPGWCKTELGGPQAMLTAAQGAETPVFVATDPSLANITGQFFMDKAPVAW